MLGKEYPQNDEVKTHNGDCELISQVETAEDNRIHRLRLARDGAKHPAVRATLEEMLEDALAARAEFRVKLRRPLNLEAESLRDKFKHEVKPNVVQAEKVAAQVAANAATETAQEGS